MRIVRRLLFCWTLFAGSWTALAGSIDVQWNPVPKVKGYRVYYGTESGRYTDVLDVKTKTSATITGLSDCTTWYVAVKAYTRKAESAAFSNEVSGWPRPRVTSVGPDTGIQGSRFTLEIRGANFRAGASAQIDNPHVFLDSAASLSCTRMQVAVSIEPTARGVRAAQVGRHTLTVLNPDDVFGSGPDLFEVRIDPARFDIDRRPGPSAGRLDGRDTIWLSRYFGTPEGDPNHHPDSDFDGDGWVDGADLAYLVSNLGRCWNGTGWSIAACVD